MYFDLVKQQTRLTELLIELQGAPITLTRQTFAPDGQGGVVMSNPQAEATPVRRYVGGVTYHHTGFEDMTPHGEVKKVTRIIVGMPTDSIEKDDEFEYQGSLWRVRSVFPEQTFEVRGECEWVRDAN